MNTHRHPSSEEICEQVSEGLPQAGIAGCEACEAEALSVARLLGDLRLANANANDANANDDDANTTQWDDLLLRRRIREAIAREKPHSPSILDRFAILRPAFVSTVLAGLVFAVWTPLSNFGDAGRTPPRSGTAISRNGGHVPAWTALPDESEDEGLAILAEWTPTEAELAIARCRFACLGALSPEEEENLLESMATDSVRTPLTGATPL